MTEPSISVYTAAQWNRDDRVKIQTNDGFIMGRRRGLIFTNVTFPAYNESLDTTLVVFLYRDPVKTVVSHGSSDICRRVRHSRSKEHSAHLCSILTGDNETSVHAAYADRGSDIMMLARYFHHYVKPKVVHNYRIIGVKFEALWTKFDDIARALCLQPGTKYAAETGHKDQSTRINANSLAELEATYASLRAEISDTPDVVVVEPGYRWKGGWVWMDGWWVELGGELCTTLVICVRLHVVVRVVIGKPRVCWFVCLHNAR